MGKSPFLLCKPNATVLLQFLKIQIMAQKKSGFFTGLFGVVLCFEMELRRGCATQESRSYFLSVFVLQLLYHVGVGGKGGGYVGVAQPGSYRGQVLP